MGTQDKESFVYEISFSIRQAADATGLSEATIRLEINKNNLPAKRYGSRILIRRVDLEAWIEWLESARN